MGHHTSRFVAFDCETTGLEADARIIELAAVRVDVPTGIVVARWRTLVNPEVPIPAAATSVHGITDAMVREAPTIAEALREFLAFMARGPAVAHHARYDVQRLTFEAQRAGVALPGNVPVYCSIDASRVAFPGEPSRGLLNLARTLGLPREGASHRAGGDAALVVQLMLRCFAAAPRDLTGYAPAVGSL